MRAVRAIVLVGVLLLSSCGNIRTVYDEFGNVVPQDSEPGGEKDITSHMEAKFNAAFSEQRNEQGVPQTTSNRVSSFQKELDKARRTDDEFATGEFASAGSSDFYTMSFSGAGKEFNVKESYTGGRGDRIERELHPAFATDSKGIYAVGDSFLGSSARSAAEGEGNLAADRTFFTPESSYTRDTQSGYFETRRDMTPPPPVMTRDEYYRKSIDETRTILGRDKTDND